ncbi:V-type ATP synthase subunit A [Fastidiosipila sanguinis]|uniref:V-type ATP synthase alpha chain n=1 Tax=Fastidiosipila sanguinis TaxID=236753 RepID=A0A2S0KLM9_9FIRM|nr:V-type ATP synthase subunit A [Fastidiosipila sanguinis]AVM41909.1 V-type ATP synthase subunit A [Fastidiosipila sanguinis]
MANNLDLKQNNSTNEKQAITGTIVKISGPLIVASGMRDVRMFDVVRVGENNLVGEVIEVHGDEASIQVYEETDGLRPGEAVHSTDHPLDVELGPGLMGTIYDGIQRPLAKMREISGSNIARGIDVNSIDHEKKWYFEPRTDLPEKLRAGDIIATVKENNVIEHKIMLPPTIPGDIEIVEIAQAGEYTVVEPIAKIRYTNNWGDVVEEDVQMAQRWPVRQGRPFNKQLAPSKPLVTGQRVVDTFFPVARGGTSTVPGPFGAGKTVIQQQLAKWSDADVVVYIGCGERGNEMTEVLKDFPNLIDPKTNESLMERTILIANTSDMPVAAREASIYTGITIAEYYRDMGYAVCIMADSTSRWAEALREMSGRLEEMPGEEGYPAYLGSRLAEFYERAGVVHALGSEEREGSITAVGAVSPPGGDMSDPVVQATLRTVKVYWELDSSLAAKRHFPAINWMSSYSLYKNTINPYFSDEVHPDWQSNQETAFKVLQDEAELEEIVRLVGQDSLSAQDQLKLEIARSIRNDYLHQNSYHEVDTYTSLQKQFYMLDLIIRFYKEASALVDAGASIDDIMDMSIRVRLSRMKYEKEDEIEAAYNDALKELEESILKVKANSRTMAGRR